jgi:hypothetical protein
MTVMIAPNVRCNFPEGFFDSLMSLPEGLGQELWMQVLMAKGAHISDIGNSRSGKSEKKKWMQLQLSRVGETIIEFDTGKEGDIECYFDNDNPKYRFNKNVTVLIPYEGGCTFAVKGVPENIRVQIIPIPAPELLPDLIQPGEINIISLRNYFTDIRKLKQYIRRVYNNFSLRARTGDFKKWTPATWSIDEAHEQAGSQRVSKDQDSMLLTAELSNMERQLASSKIRMMLTTQELKDLPEAIRKNTHVFIVNRGAYAEKSENKAIHYLEGFAERALPNEGWIVIHGRHFYTYDSVKFPLIGIPKNIRIERSGLADAPLQDDDIREMIVVDGGWRGAAFPVPDHIRESDPVFSRWDMGVE